MSKATCPNCKGKNAVKFAYSDGSSYVVCYTCKKSTKIAKAGKFADIGTY